MTTLPQYERARARADQMTARAVKNPSASGGWLAAETAANDAARAREAYRSTLSTKEAEEMDLRDALRALSEMAEMGSEPF